MRVLYSLQAFRGLAALLVVIFHASRTSEVKFGQEWLGRLFEFGFSGVDFFFVLSGFIIYHVNARDIGKPKHLQHYIPRRLIRIYPIYWAVTLASLAVVKPLGLWHFVSSVFLLPGANYPIVPVAWTLRYEVCFYFVFGVAIAWGGRAATILSLVLLAATRDTLFIEFALGCLAAHLVQKKAVKQAALPLMIAGCVAFLVTGFYELKLRPALGVQSGALFYATASFFIVLGAATLESRGRFNVPRVLRYLGDASYSIYLIHTPAQAVIGRVLARLNSVNHIGLTPSVLLVIAFSAAAGCMCYSLLEKPMLHALTERFIKKPRSSKKRESAAPSTRRTKLAA